MVATPEAFREAVPSVVDPTVKTTLPVGIAPLPVTLAVSVTGCPAFTVVAEDDNAVVDVALPVTFTTTAVDVDPPMFALPAYVAVTERAPEAVVV